MSLRSFTFAALAMSVPAYLWLGGAIFIAGVHLPPVLVAAGAAGAVLVALRSPAVMVGRLTVAFLLIASMAVAWLTVVNLRTDLAVGEALELGFGRISAGLAFVFSMVIVATPRRVRILARVLVLTGAASALVAVGQYFVGGPFLWLWDVSGGFRPAADEVAAGRVAGLAAYAIPFSYHMVAIIPVGVAVALTTWGPAKSAVVWGASALMIAALVLSSTRSAVLAVGLSLLAIFVTMPKRDRHTLRKQLTVTTILVALLLSSGLADRLISVEDESAKARLPLAQAAIEVAITHPLGVGKAGYGPAVSAVFQRVPELSDDPIILEATSHNQFLNMLAYYGFPGLLLLLICYLLLFKILRRASRRQARVPHDRVLTVGIMASTGGYVVHSLFHNAGPFTGDPVAWVMIALALAHVSVAMSPLERNAHGASCRGLETERTPNTVV